MFAYPSAQLTEDEPFVSLSSLSSAVKTAWKSTTVEVEIALLKTV